MAYILRTQDNALHLAPGGHLMPPGEAAPLTFSSADHAYRMVQTQPDFAGLVVDVLP